MAERNSFVVGGPVPLESRAYVERSFEEELFSALTANEWVVLLGPRQSGKTSALARLYRRLSTNGFGCAFLDLQAYGADDSYGHFLRWLSQAVAKDVGGIATEREDLESLEEALEETLPDKPASIVLLLDEISALPESWRKRFFGQLRAIFNARTRGVEDSVPRRLACVFGGTFRPEEMIEGDNSPFNVSRYVKTAEFSEADLSNLVAAVEREELSPYIPTIYNAVRGQPYLSQLLLSYVERSAGSEQADPVEDGLRRVSSGEDRHLSSLARQIKADRGMRDLLPEILSGSLRFDGTDDDHLFAEVIGVAREENGRLIVANSLYAASFEGLGREEQFVEPTLPDRVDVLIVTANDIETASVHDAFSGGADYFRVGENSYLDLGINSGIRIVTIRCPDMGSVGSAASTLVVADAIREVNPTVVAMVGVAFGLVEEDQQIGTILVPDEVAAYEVGRIGTDDGGTEQRVDRSPHYNLDPTIHGRLRDLAVVQEEDIQFGIVLSGEKLVDNKAFRDSLLEIEPEAIGGEMEAAGVCAAAERARVPWVIVKAVCDFADGNKGTEKEFNQKMAADNATEFLRRAVEAGALSL
ncbi:MAG TPA: AAA-like domain-containing protein [Solirubrobacterales bacterium]